MGNPAQVAPPKRPYNPPPVIPVTSPLLKDAVMNGSTRSLVVKVGIFIFLSLNGNEVFFIGLVFN